MLANLAETSSTFSAKEMWKSFFGLVEYKTEIIPAKTLTCVAVRGVNIVLVSTALQGTMEGDRMEVGNQKQNVNVEVHVKSNRWVKSAYLTMCQCLGSRELPLRCWKHHQPWYNNIIYK